LKQKVKIGTRGSRLALWQAEFVKRSLAETSPEIEFEIVTIKTTGDRFVNTTLSKIGDKGLFTREIENALLSSEIDLAVHSLKDLPTTLPDGLRIGAVTKREKPNDVLISKSICSIADLPQNASVATGSLRRKSQLLHLRPDVDVVDMRGNVPTRVEKFFESVLDAMILAYAGIHRLELDECIRQVIPLSDMIPAVGQGAVAVEVHEDNDVSDLLAAINDTDTQICTTSERAFLRMLEGGCQVPIGGNAVFTDLGIELTGFIGSLDGAMVIKETISGPPEDAENLGTSLAVKCIERGASEILQASRSESLEASADGL
jgi:hydroxymethylbilane synthase